METRNHKEIQAVIFDMDGTLIDTERIGAASWDHAAADVGFCVSAEVVKQMVGRNMRDIRRLVEEALPDRDVEPLLDRANFHYHRLVTERPPPIKPGAEELLGWLEARSIPLGVATSSMRNQAEDKLGRTGLRDFFQVVVAGDEVEQGKPHPEIFHRSAEGLEVSPERCAVFEDSGAGIEAARRSGSLAVLVPEHDPVDPDMAGHAHVVLESLTAARDLLEPRLTGRP